MPIIELDDPGDQRVANYQGVRDPELVRRGDIFIAEGRQIVSELLTAQRFPVQSVLVTKTARHALADALSAHPQLPVYVVPPQLVHEIAGFHIHQGCLAIGSRKVGASWQEIATTTSRLLVLEGVGNPDNVGGIFRNARAFSAGGVLLGPGCADPLYRKAIRTSMGATLDIPFAHVTQWPEALRTLRTQGWAVVATTPIHEARALRATARTIEGRPVAVVLGQEGDGLSTDAIDACEFSARIPMVAGVDSLNVSTAAAIVLYEISRHD